MFTVVKAKVLYKFPAGIVSYSSFQKRTQKGLQIVATGIFTFVIFTGMLLFKRIWGKKKKFFPWKWLNNMEWCRCLSFLGWRLLLIWTLPKWSTLSKYLYISTFGEFQEKYSVHCWGSTCLSELIFHKSLYWLTLKKKCRSSLN